MCLSIAIDPIALDVLHHEVGQSVVGRSAVEQARDVRVFEGCQDLPLVLETAQDRCRCPCRA